MKLIIFIVIIILLIYVGVDYKAYILKEKSKLSFKEALDLTALPIITFTHNGHKFNFMLDTGSNSSYLDKRLLSKVKPVTLTDINQAIVTGGSVISSDTSIVLPISNRDITFNHNFDVINLSEQLDAIKNCTGVTIHGILGTDMLGDHHYVLDFKDCIAYLK